MDKSFVSRVSFYGSELHSATITHTQIRFKEETNILSDDKPTVIMQSVRKGKLKFVVIIMTWQISSNKSIHYYQILEGDSTPKLIHSVENSDLGIFSLLLRLNCVIEPNLSNLSLWVFGPSGLTRFDRGLQKRFVIPTLGNSRQISKANSDLQIEIIRGKYFACLTTNGILIISHLHTKKTLLRINLMRLPDFEKSDTIPILKSFKRWKIYLSIPSRVKKSKHISFNLLTRCIAFSGSSSSTHPSISFIIRRPTEVVFTLELLPLFIPEVQKWRFVGSVGDQAPFKLSLAFEDALFVIPSNDNNIVLIAGIGGFSFVRINDDLSISKIAEFAGYGFEAIHSIWTSLNECCIVARHHNNFHLIKVIVE